MPLNKPIETIRQELQTQLVEDIAGALKALQDMLPPNSDKLALIIALLGRLNDANKARLRNTLSNDDLQLEYNKIRADLFDLIQGLQETDFDAATAAAQPAADSKPAAKKGSVLYRIPQKMPKGKETKCVVRIALSEDAIVENITIDENVQLKELYRVSDTMQVELVDPSEGEVFAIRSINDPIQIIDEEGFTEWWFYVKPKVEGSYPLILKVAIIEIINGEPRHKELVMEETVQIVAEETPPEAGDAALKPAGYTLSLQTSATSTSNATTAAMAGMAAVSTQAPASANPSVAAQAVLQKVALYFAIAAAAVTGAWFITPPEIRDWWRARYVSDKIESYQAFLDKYQDCSVRKYDEAAFRKAELLNTPEAYRTYLMDCRGAKSRPAAMVALQRLEKEAVQQLEASPDLSGLRAFLINFPCSPLLKDVQKIAEKDSVLSAEYLPLIVQQLKDCGPDAGAEDHPVISGAGVDSVPEKITEVPNHAEPSTNTPTSSAPAPKPESPQPSTTDKPAPVPAEVPNMVLVRGGPFQMGKKDAPVRQLTLADFYLGKTEVTFADYDRFCAATGRQKPKDESWGRGDHPVMHVTWFDAAAYCNWLSQQDKLTPYFTFVSDHEVTMNRSANGYRLPTEAEWEYAARGGEQDKGFFYSGSDDLNEVGWYLDNSDRKTHPVGHLHPNSLGLFDMSGNVREWCLDGVSGSKTSPTKAVRGGSWGRNPNQLLCTYRNTADQSYEDFDTGFRIVRSR